uniref:Ribonuclease H-like domain-containing protein n=1 Tax=Tanacetum cinerariifolium TaxID=118510 RepID=A0A699GJW2_TANCI|nr:ribonuclease H-like domain-containing protein [Tanacetum cinerariifolium]
MCDRKNNVLFTDTECLVSSPNFKLPDESQILLRVPRKNNMYSVDMKNIVSNESLTCVVAKATLDESMLWHKRLGHINFKNIDKLVKDNLVSGLPSKRFENNQTCVACLMGKQHKASCKSKIQNSISQPLFRLHMDLFGPTFVSNLRHKKYGFVVTNDYSRYTWVFFLETKDETTCIFKKFITEIENLVDKKVKVIRCDNGTEFKNSVLNDFSAMKCIIREFSVTRTPQQTGVAERRNRTLIEAARTMLADFKLPTTFWAEAVNTACYVQNRVLVVKPHNKTPYKLFRGRTPTLSFIRPFGSHVTILNTLDYLSKFDGKADEGFFIGYSLNSKAFRVYNTKTRKVEENLHVRFLKYKPIIAGDRPKWLFHIDVLTKSMNYVPVVADELDNVVEKEDGGWICFLGDTNSLGTKKYQGLNSNDGGYIVDGVKIIGGVIGSGGGIGGISSFLEFSKKSEEMFPGVAGKLLQPLFGDAGKKHDEVSDKESGASNELNCAFENLNTEYPDDSKMPGLETIDTNDDYEEETDFTNLESSIHVSPTPTTRILKNYPLKQMDVKSAFLYERIEKEVYVCQALGFKDPDHLDKVYKAVKALYGLDQAPRAWYETLAKYLLSNRFHRGKIDQTLFIKKQKEDILLVQVYVDDIIFGSTKKELCVKFERLMKDKFQMSSMGDLTFFLRLQVKQKEDRIFISQDKYVAEVLRIFDFSNVKSTSTPIDTKMTLVKDANGDDLDVHLYRSMIGSLMYLTASRPNIMYAVCICARFQVTPKASLLHAVKRFFRYLKGHLKLGLWFPRDFPFELVAYTDSDYVRASLDRKSTTGGCQFLGSILILWQRKKQTVVATSTTEVEYVAVASCCGQVKQSSMVGFGEMIQYNLTSGLILIITHSLMANLEFCNKHNMVAYLKKPTGSEGFQEIIDFLNGSHIGYALTKNLTIYVSLIKKFWKTATVRTVDNREQEITATVDDKEFTMTEAFIRRHVQLVDTDGISVLPNTKFFDQLSLMGELVQVVVPGVHTPGSDEERSKQHELIVLALEESKTAQYLVITSLKLRVKNLEKKKKKARTPQPLKRRLFKVRVESFAEENLDEGDPSKQGRSMIEEIDQDAGVTLVQIDAMDQESFDDETNFDAGTPTQMQLKNVQTYNRKRRRAVSTGSGEISTASRLFSTAEVSVSTFGMVQRVNISIPSPVVVKDEGEGKMQEYEDEQTKRTKLQQEQDRLGFKVAMRLQEELDEEERQRMARRLQAEERNKYSEVDQAKMLAQNVKAKRNKLMTQAQQRAYMSTYIKNMGSYIVNKSKKLSFDEIKKVFETTMKIVNTFIPMETEVRGRASELAAGSSQATITDSAGVGMFKRVAEAELDYDSSKRQKTNEASGSEQP